MSEKVYTTMKSVGITDLIIGICVIVIGLVAGIVAIVNGARLLKRKSELLF